MNVILFKFINLPSLFPPKIVTINNDVFCQRKTVSNNITKEAAIKTKTFPGMATNILVIK